ncbi:MAG: YfiR family protein [Candidatus Eisenbacteria bacterium]
MPQSPIVPSHVLEDRIGCGGVLQGAVGRSRSLRLLFVLGVLGALAAIGVSPAWASPTEPELKAALVFNFAQFVVWPPEARPHPGESLVVGVIGTGELAEALAQGLRDKSLDGAPLSIQRCRDLDDLASCRVLVFDAEPSAWQGVLAQPSPGDSSPSATARSSRRRAGSSEWCGSTSTSASISTWPRRRRPA